MLFLRVVISATRLTAALTWRDAVLIALVICILFLPAIGSVQLLFLLHFVLLMIPLLPLVAVYLDLVAQLDPAAQLDRVAQLDPAVQLDRMLLCFFIFSRLRWLSSCFVNVGSYGRIGSKWWWLASVGSG